MKLESYFATSGCIVTLHERGRRDFYRDWKTAKNHPTLEATEMVPFTIPPLRLLSFFPALFIFLSFADAEEKWIPLFNGKDLSGWTPKIRFENYGEDPRETFRVEDGLLKVGYENYDEFKETFGHLFYETPFSNYRLRLEYRFIGDQVKGGPGWAFRNSGVMVHGQDPATMVLDQDFPVSIEVQLLGGDGKAERTNANLCTPGTHVFMDGELIRKHCVSSSSKTFPGDDWVTVEIEVRGNEVIRHIAGGEVVLEYRKPILDATHPQAAELIEKAGGKIELSAGTISLQSESHPVEFRKVEVLELEE